MPVSEIGLFDILRSILAICRLTSNSTLAGCSFAQAPFLPSGPPYFAGLDVSVKETRVCCGDVGSISGLPPKDGVIGCQLVDS
jgi:hypothetical protein